MANTPGRFERSWELVKASAAVLRSDRELIVLPVISGLASLLVIAAFGGVLYETGAFEALQHSSRAAETTGVYVGLFVFYLVQYFIIIFFNTALVGAAIQRLEGGDPTIGSALSIAMSRVGPIFGYAVVSATVGLVLRAIAERLGFVGRIIESLIGVAWTVATFLVVPILAAEGTGPLAAIKRSASLLRQTWGENLIGNAGISIVTGIIALVVAVVCFGGGTMLLRSGTVPLAIALFAIGLVIMICVAIIGSALSAVYSAAVYRFAVDGKAPAGFDANLIQGAFRHKT